MKKKMLFKLIFTILIITVSVVLSGCSTTPGNSNRQQSFNGVWKLENSYLSDNAEFNFLVIKSDSIIESWTDRGLAQLYFLKPDQQTLEYKTFSTLVPEWEGEKLNLDASITGTKLHLLFRAGDRTKEWEQVYDSVAELPSFSRKDNFENGIPQFIKTDRSENGAGWQIIEDPDNRSNSVYALTSSDKDSDAEFQISPGKNFSIKFDMKKTPGGSIPGNQVMALDFFMYQPVETAEGSSYRKSDDKMELDLGSKIDDNRWYKIRVSFSEGRYFQVALDGVIFKEGEVGLSYVTGLRIKGNPDGGDLFIDNMTITCNEETKISKVGNSGYFTDFSSNNAEFSFNTGDPTCDTAEIAGGVLHLRAKDYSGNKSGALAKFFKEIPRNSTVSFIVRFGDYFNTQHPAGHFNFLYKNSENRIVFMTGKDGFSYFTVIKGNQHDDQLNNFSFTTGHDYKFRFHLKEYSVDIYLDNLYFDSVEYPNGLPKSGYFIFECHNEYWVKEFRYKLNQ